MFPVSVGHGCQEHLQHGLTVKNQCSALHQRIPRFPAEVERRDLIQRRLILREVRIQHVELWLHCTNGGKLVSKCR